MKNSNASQNKEMSSSNPSTNSGMIAKQKDKTPLLGISPPTKTISGLGLDLSDDDDSNFEKKMELMRIPKNESN